MGVPRQIVVEFIVRREQHLLEVRQPSGGRPGAPSCAERRATCAIDPLFGVVSCHCL